MTRLHPWLLAGLALAAGCRRGGRGDAVESCVPGETLVVACAAGCGLGSCIGDPVLRVCDGTLGTEGCRSETDSTMFVSVDDTACGGLCPRLRVTCPPSGTVAVTHRPLGSGDYECNWEVDARGILPPGGRAAETVACTAGAPYVVGCSLACGLGECEGSPSLRICDGTASVDACRMPATPQLRFESTTGCPGGCPYRVVQCPASGSMTVVPDTTGGALCEWDIRQVPSRPPATETCSPGQRLVVGCAQDCGNGSCEGEVAIRVCDGNVMPAACDALTGSGWLEEGRMTTCASSGNCAEAVVTCPGSGAITVVPRSYWSDDQPFACDWAVRPAGVGE
jgi:hypothetical protein